MLQYRTRDHRGNAGGDVRGNWRKRAEEERVAPIHTPMPTRASCSLLYVVPNPWLGRVERLSVRRR